MSKTKKKRKRSALCEEERYIYNLTVRVSGIEGPLDMMRYDRCYPATEGDSRKLIRIANGTAKGKDHIVSFVQACPYEHGPTEQRWESFNCKVLEIDGIELG